MHFRSGGRYKKVGATCIGVIKLMLAKALTWSIYLAWAKRGGSLPPALLISAALHLIRIQLFTEIQGQSTCICAI